MSTHLITYAKAQGIAANRHEANQGHHRRHRDTPARTSNLFTNLVAAIHRTRSIGTRTVASAPTVAVI